LAAASASSLPPAALSAERRERYISFLFLER
jgi:hypothetical protein